MKLLNRTAIAYFVVSLLLLVVVTPIFYYVLNTLFVEEADETLIHRKEFVVSRLDQIKNAKEITDWTRFEDDIAVIPLPEGTLPRPDSLYDGIEHGNEHFRELVTQVTIYGKPHQLMIRNSMLEKGDLIRTIVVSQILLLGALLLCLLLINRWIAGKIWQPFYETLAKLKNYSLSRRVQPALGSTNIVEFSELNAVVNQMTHKIQDDFISLKQFTENASHEIQTPLAIIKSKLEVMIQDESLSAEQMLGLQTIYEATGRLSRLNQALLLLTKIENDQFAATERLNFKRFIEEALSLFDDFIQSKNLSVTAQLTDCWLNLNPSLVRVLLTNLIGNAIKHNTAGSELRVVLAERYFEISNPGAAPLQAPEAFFERFHKGSSHSDSLGLGLAIVQEICIYSGLGIHYAFEKGLHIVRVEF
jgi:signal transduction histidine kinase